MKKERALFILTILIILIFALLFIKQIYYAKLLADILFLLLIISIFLTQCNNQVKNEMQKKPIEQVLKDNQDMLLSVNGVQGFYQGLSEEGNDIIVVMVDTLTKVIREKIPDSLDGYPVLLEETGEIKPLNNDEEKLSP